MAEFSRLVITNKGQALLAKMMTGEGNVEFTKISTSDMEYTLEQLEALTEFSGVKQTVSVSKVTRTNGVAVTIETTFDNTELTQGYHMRALGLYAIDPDDGEILYAVTTEMSGCCYMPAYNGITISGACIKLVTTVGNAENVSLEVDPGVYATVGEIKELRELIADTYLTKIGNSADNTVSFNIASERTEIQSGEKHETLFGKMKKWLSDLKAVAFSGSYNDLSDKPDAQSVGALPDTGGVIANDSDRSITIQPTYIQGDGTQRLTDFYKISADSVEANHLHYSNEDTDDRYVKRDNVLTTMEAVDSNTSEENIAGATVVKKLKSDLESNINQINSNLAAKMTTVTILPVSTYEIGKEYTPDYDARKCKFFMPIIIWRETPVVTRRWYSDGYETIQTSDVICENDIAVIRSVQFKINMTSGTIEVESYRQANLQPSANWFLSPNLIDGLGLIGIKG